MKINWFQINYNTIENILLKLIHDSNRYEYLSFIVFLRQGYFCKDCGENYNKCYCQEYDFEMPSLEKTLNNINSILVKVFSEFNIKKFIENIESQKNKYKKELKLPYNPHRWEDQKAIKTINYFLKILK